MKKKSIIFASKSSQITGGYGFCRFSIVYLLENNIYNHLTSNLLNIVF